MAPRFDEIDAELAALSELRERPAGTIRITAGEHAGQARSCGRRLRSCCRDYPDIKVEVIVDQGLTDIVSERYDAGVRLGEQVDKDMIAVRIGPDMRMAVVGAPSYFARRRKPKTPHDLTEHNCINLRLPTLWRPLRLGIRERRARAEGARRRAAGVQHHRLAAEGGARPGFGLACLPEEQVASHLADGGWFAFWPIGARRSPATTSIIRAAASRRRLSSCCWRRCAIASEGERREVRRKR